MSKGPAALHWIALTFTLGMACALSVGCNHHKLTTSGLIHVTLQTDWYPQPEQGGFYNAMVKGYYKTQGLDVEIQPGGPYSNGEQQVATGAAQFGMGSSDRLLEAVAGGQPVIAVAATMQHDPQALMVHKDSAVKSFGDLDGSAVAVKPPATWFEYLVKRYALRDVREIPATFSVANFIQDPKYIQQIFVTSEPYFAHKANVEIRALLISDTGYNPYRVIFTSKTFAKEHPDVVAKFVRASIEGWRDYLERPTEANALISKLNPAMDVDQMQFTWKALRDGRFITGEDTSGANIGHFDPARWNLMYRQLSDLKVIQKPIDPASAYTPQYMNIK